MAVLKWDEVGERIYHTGVDRGVLYLQDGTVAVWNGLTSMEESVTSELKSFFLDGVKYLENLAPGDYVGKLKAFTYPDEFDTVNGIAIVAPGLSYYEQPPKSFGMTYRTKIGNDVEGEEYGYKIHILYNLLAQPEVTGYTSLQDSGAQPVEFGWLLTGTPKKINKLRPTVHVAIDSRTTDPRVLELVEAQLYGTETTNPILPPITEVGEFFGYRGALLIVDFGDGTWMAFDEADNYINYLSALPNVVSPDPTTIFEIVGADAVFLDADSYTLSSTNIGEQG